MAQSSASGLPRVPAEQRRVAAAQFDRANQVLSAGDFDYGLQLLMNCCEIDPGNPIYRQALHQAQRSKYKDNQRGQPLAVVLSVRSRWRLFRALRREDHRAALRYAEEILLRNPWDVAAHLHLADAFDGLGQLDLAIWTLEQVRPLRSKDPKLNRPLARYYERRGNFTQAIALWEQVRKARPDDLEAHHKAKDLAASATIARGRYQEAVNGEGASPLLPSAPRVPAGVTEASEQPGADGEVSANGAERAPREAAAIQAKIQANPANANNYLQLAGYYRRLDQLDRARAVLTQGLVPSGNHFEIAQELLDLDIEPLRRNLALTLEQLRKQPKKADLQKIQNELQTEINARELDYFRRRADRSPTDTAARFEISLRLLRGGQIDEAIRELQAIRTDPRHHGKALFYLGFCFQTRKNWRLAQRNFEEALTHMGDDPLLRKEALYYLALGYAEAGDLNRAIDFGCELANLDFSYKDIGTRLDEWQTKAPKTKR